MSSYSNYIHGTAPDEQQRLRLLNELTNKDFIDFLSLSGTERVLELGSGLGILCAAVAMKLYKGRATGIELSKDQLSKCPQFPHNLEFVLGDVHDLPFENNSFDLVYGRYILEHISNPIVALKEAYRVLIPEGKIYFQENSILWIEFYPSCPHFMYAWKKFAQFQSMIGGDAMIGIKLFDRLKKVGFKNIKISLAPEVHTADDTSFKIWISNLIGNLRSAETDLVQKNHLTQAEFNSAIQEMEEFKQHPFASAYFAWNRISASK